MCFFFVYIPLLLISKNLHNFIYFKLILRLKRRNRCVTVVLLVEAALFTSVHYCTQVEISLFIPWAKNTLTLILYYSLFLFIII